MRFCNNVLYINNFPSSEIRSTSAQVHLRFMKRRGSIIWTKSRRSFLESGLKFQMDQTDKPAGNRNTSKQSETCRNTGEQEPNQNRTNKTATNPNSPKARFQLDSVLFITTDKISRFFTRGGHDLTTSRPHDIRNRTTRSQRSKTLN